MENFFGLTDADLQNGKAKFADGDKAVLQITSVVKKEIKDRPKMIFDCVVLDGANIGLKHSMFFSMDIEGGRKALGMFLTSLVPPAQLKAMSDPSALINTKFSCDFVDNKGFIGERNCKPYSDVPTGIPAAAPQAATVNPVQTPVQVEQAVSLGKSLF